MVEHIIRLANVLDVTAGTTLPSLKSVTLTHAVNQGDLLDPGAVCSAMLEATFYSEPDKWLLRPGTKMTLFTRYPDGSLVQEGIFYPEKVEWIGKNCCKAIAFDNMILLDQDVTAALDELTYPISLQNLAAAVCQYCKLTLSTRAFQNGTFQVTRPAGYRITGRQVMKWICQLAGLFCRLTPDGKLELAWYTPASVKLGLDPSTGKTETVLQNGHLTVRSENITATAEGVTLESMSCINGNMVWQIPDSLPTAAYLRGGLRRGAAPLQCVGGVWLAYSYATPRVVYPDVYGNVLDIVGNPLLENATQSSMRTLARSLYDQFRPIVYTTCDLKIPAEAGVKAGQILTFSVGEQTFTTYVMRTVRAGSVTRVISTGEYRRDSPIVVNNRK